MRERGFRRTGIEAGRRATHPSTSNYVEHVLAARQIGFEFEPNLRIDKIRDVEGNQVRLSAHRAPKEMVKRFAEQMKAGANFPAIVVNENCEMVDGNTRRMAALKNGRETISAYICSGLSALQARSLSVELNQSHGLSMTEAEVRAFVMSAVQEGRLLDTRSAARMTGVPTSRLSRWVACAQFQVRVQRYGLALGDGGELSDGVRVALHVARLKSVFAEAAALAVAARMPATQLRRLITRANNAPSETEALKVVAEERKERASEIKAIAGGFKVAKRKRRQVAIHIRGLLKLDVEELLDVAPEDHEEAFIGLQALQRHIDVAVAQARTRWNATGTNPVAALPSPSQPAGFAGAVGRA